MNVSETNGGHLYSRIEELEKMDKLLLRAQVLQQDALEALQKFVASHAKALEDQANWQQEQEKWKQEQKKRDEVLDERIGKLVSAIGLFIAKAP